MVAIDVPMSGTTMRGQFSMCGWVYDYSVSLGDSGRLKDLLNSAEFRDIHVESVTREGSYASFEEYWTAIESGPGLIPQAYRLLPAARRAEVRDAVREQLMPFEHDGRLAMSVDMVIGTGRA